MHNKILSGLLLAGLLLLGACGGTTNVGSTGPTTQDNINPVIGSISGLLDGDTVSGTVPIAASATDNKGVVSFTLRINGEQVVSNSGGSMSYNWITTGGANGSYSLVFTAADEAGNTTTRTYGITVNNGGGAGATGTVTGSVLAPNGVDPISQALIYLFDSGQPGNQGTSDESEPDGSFSLGGIPVGTQTFVLRKGIFEETFSFNVQEGSNVLPSGLTTLDAADAGEMLVVTGQYDVIENVLAKLGLGQVDASGNLIPGTEIFQLVDGAGKLDDATYDDFDELFIDSTGYSSYRTIFLNCGNDFEAEFFADADAANNLRDWVEAGGRLYCTDWSYDFAEQLWPEMVSFENTAGSGDGLGSTPGLANEAQLGASQGEVQADIEDAFLLSWLNGRGAANPDNTLDVTDWLPAWSVIHSVDPAVKVWVSGTVSFGFPSTTQERPLTISFEAGSGNVLFSSYHTEENASSALTPQDRVLQFLIFEVL
ncbi:MAG: Ig-like domain-containing protein [bacterium]